MRNYLRIAAAAVLGIAIGWVSRSHFAIVADGKDGHLMAAEWTTDWSLAPIKLRAECYPPTPLTPYIWQVPEGGCIRRRGDSTETVTCPPAPVAPRRPFEMSGSLAPFVPVGSSPADIAASRRWLCAHDKDYPRENCR